MKDKCVLISPKELTELRKSEKILSDKINNLETENESLKYSKQYVETRNKELLEKNKELEKKLEESINNREIDPLKMSIILLSSTVETSLYHKNLKTNEIKTFNFDLSLKLRPQLIRIAKIFSDRYESQYRIDLNEIYKELANKKWYERRKYLKKYKKR